MQFYINATPMPKKRPDSKNGRRYKDAKTREYEKFIRSSILRETTLGARHPKNEAVNVSILFVIDKPQTSKNNYPVVKPDLDNYVKSILDALNTVAYEDDSQVVDLKAKKRYAKGSMQKGIYIKVQRLSQYIDSLSEFRFEGQVGI